MKFTRYNIWGSSFEPSLPVKIIQATSAMAVPTQSDIPLKSHSVTYVASVYPDFYLPNIMNTRLSQTVQKC